MFLKIITTSQRQINRPSKCRLLVTMKSIEGNLCHPYKACYLAPLGLRGQKPRKDPRFAQVS